MEQALSGRFSPLSALFLLCDLPLRSCSFVFLPRRLTAPLHPIYGSLRSHALLETKTITPKY